MQHNKYLHDNDVAFAFVSYEEIDDGKRRPIVLYEIRQGYIKAFKVTSKFSSKSENVKKTCIKSKI